MLALCACSERPGLAAQPWFSLSLPCRLHHPDHDHAVPARPEAISETGVELRLTPPAGPWPGAAGDGAVSASPRRWAIQPPTSAANDRQLQGWRLTLPGLPEPLPLAPEVWHQRRLGADWGPMAAEQRQALRRFLVGHEGLWPQRNAAPEPLALLVVLARLVRESPPQDWFRRSLILQAAPPAAPP